MITRRNHFDYKVVVALFDLWDRNPMIFEHNNYRAYLKTLFAERKRGNPSYSMRAFAKQIGLGQSALSQVLAGKKNISVERGSQIAGKLTMT